MIFKNFSCKPNRKKMAAAYASDHSLCTDHCNAVNSNTGVTSATYITCVLVILTSDTTLMTTLTPRNPYPN